MHMSHRSVRQIPGSGSVNSIHPEKKEMLTEIQSGLCQFVDSLCYLLTKQGVQWSQEEPGSAGEQTQPCERVKEDKKGHGTGRGRRDKSCLCFLSHLSPLRGIHHHT